MARLVAIATAAVALAVRAHQCMHDELMAGLATNVPHSARHLETTASQQYDVEIDHHSGRVLQDTFIPIRIKVDLSRLYPDVDGVYACQNASMQYIPTLGKTLNDRTACTAADVLDDTKRNYLINTLIPAAVGFYQNALSVRPVQGNLVLPNPMSDNSCGLDGSRTFAYSLVCCNKFFPASYKTSGVADADFLLVVTARPTSGNVLAWATECQSDQYGRPLCGQANISPARMSTSPNDFQAQVGVVTHEIGHALGFSSSKFGVFRKPGTLQQVSSVLDVVDYVYGDQYLGKDVKRIITPKVVSFLKSHLNCDSWPKIGGELEDGGGSGTAGSHWDKRVVMNELMNPTSETFMVKSGLTLALFEDSGWYQANYDAAEPFTWGKGQGCDFMRSKCSASWSPDYFCRVAGEAGCTADMRFQATCNLDQNPYITYPSQYQYFPGNPGWAGKDQYADYCPFYQVQSNRDCSNPNSLAYFFWGERPGSGARCFRGTYQLNIEGLDFQMHGGCLQTACNKLTNLIEVTLSGSPSNVVVTCPAAGGTVDVSQFGSGRFNGTLICPPAAQLCTGKPCDIQDCNRNGKCNAEDGSCSCYAGYYGLPEPGGDQTKVYSCQYKYCPGPVDNSTGRVNECNGNGKCNADLGICTDGQTTTQPGCYPGWKGTDCGTRGCPERGTMGECSGRGTCSNGRCVCNSGYIGSDCYLTDCPYRTVNGTSQRCSGAAAGQCNLDIGVCECTDTRGDNGAPLYYSGSACQTMANGTRPYLQLNFTGETDEATNETGVPVTAGLSEKAYQYFSFRVPNPQFKITVTLSLIDLQPYADRVYMTASYEDTGRPSATSADFYSNKVDDYTRSIVLEPPTGTTSSGAFNRAGRILVAVLTTAQTVTGNVDTPLRVNITVERDGCAVLTCAFGRCSNGRCICDTASETLYGGRMYGWSGLLCDQPDCPGTPDCSGGRRGTCVVPAAAFTVNGTAVRGSASLPSCRCNGFFTGNSCSDYQTLRDAGAYIAGQTVTEREGWGFVNNEMTIQRLTNPNINVVYNDYRDAWFVKEDEDGAKVMNISLTGRLEAGASAPLIAFDQGRNLNNRFFGMAGTLGLYLRLDATSSPKSDPIMLGDVETVPSLGSYRDFDEGAWRANKRVQEISTVLNPSASPEGDFYVMSLLNGRYAQDRLDYRLFVEIATGCPPSLKGCSGHGHCNYKCVCEKGWEGLRCESFVPQIEEYVPDAPATPPSTDNSTSVVNSTTTGGVNTTSTGGDNSTATNSSRLLMTRYVEAPEAPEAPVPSLSMYAPADAVGAAGLYNQPRHRRRLANNGLWVGRATTPLLGPGQTVTFIVEAFDDTTEVAVSLEAVSTGRASLPMLKGAWSATRGNSYLVTSSSAVYDYDAVRAGNGTQHILVRRTNAQQQRYLYVSVANDALARSGFSGRVKAEISNETTITECTGTAAQCRDSVCNGRGSYKLTNGVPACACDLGWSADTFCASPSFRSLQDVTSAAQSVGFLCSVCAETQFLDRDGVAIFKVPQPLARGSGLTLIVQPLPTQRNVTTASVGSAGASSATNVTLVGIPSLLISTKLPRSLLDFEQVATLPNTQTAGGNRRMLGAVNASAPGAVSISLTDQSPTGSYYVAVYANSPGTFTVGATRSRVPLESTKFKFQLDGIEKWLVSTTAGLAVIGVGASLCFLTTCSCLLQCFCGRIKSLGKMREVMTKMEEAKAKQLEEEEEKRRAKERALRNLKASQRNLQDKPALQQALKRQASNAAMRQQVTATKSFVIPGAEFLAIGTAPRPLSSAPPAEPKRRAPATASLLVQALNGGDAEMKAKVDDMAKQAEAGHLAALRNATGAYGGIRPVSAAGPADLQSMLLATAAGNSPTSLGRQPPLGTKGSFAPPAGPKLPPGSKSGPSAAVMGGGLSADFAATNPMVHR